MIFHIGACTRRIGLILRQIISGITRAYEREIVQAKTGVIYASSAAIYGDGSNGLDDEMPIDRLRPLNRYTENLNMILTYGSAPSFLPGSWLHCRALGYSFQCLRAGRRAHKGRMASMVFRGWNQIPNSGQSENCSI